MNFLFLKKHKDIFKIILLIIALVVLSRILTYLIFVIRCHVTGAEISLLNFVDSLNKVDVSAYTSIVHFGYTTSRVLWNETYKYNYNFFPLFPLFLKFVYLVFPNRNLPCIFDETGAEVWDYYLFLLSFIFNSILLIFVCLFSYKYVMHTRNNKEMAVISIILLIFGPFSCYSYEAMSETLFMFLLIMALYSLKKGYYIRMGICGALLSASRSNGVFLILIVLVEIIQKYFTNNKQRSFKGFLQYCFSKPTLILGVSLIPLGLISYMIYLQIKIGDGLGFIHTQKYGWNQNYRGFFMVLFTCEPIHAIMTLFALMICLYLIVEKKYSEATLPILTYLLVGSITLASIARYFFSCVTIMYGFLDLLYNIKFKDKKPKQIFTYGIVSFLCLYGFVVQYYLSSWDYIVVYG